MPLLPDVDAVRAWCDVSVASISDEQLLQVMQAEAVNQSKACRIFDPLDVDADLVQAFLRRIARVLAARGVPLGVVSNEQGPQRLASFDAEIERLEGYSRKFSFG